MRRRPAGKLCNCGGRPPSLINCGVAAARTQLLHRLGREAHTGPARHCHQSRHNSNFLLRKLLCLTVCLLQGGGGLGGLSYAAGGQQHGFPGGEFPLAGDLNISLQGWGGPGGSPGHHHQHQ